MAEVIEMPKLSDTMAEGVIASWNVKVGDSIEAGEVLAEVETDKATMELESYFDGTVLHLAVEEGAAVPLGQLIAIIGEEGEDIADLLKQHEGGGNGQSSDESGATESSGSPAPAESTGGEQAAAPASSTPAATQAAGRADSSAAATPEGRIKASPLAKKMAQENKLDLARIQGSGEGGRIVRRDIEAALEQGLAQPATAPQPGPAPMQEAAAPPPPPVDDDSLYEEANVSQMRKTIARRLAESKYTAPHYYLTMAIDMKRAAEFRKQLNEELAKKDAKVSFNDILIKAVAAALKKHPKVNANWLGDKLRYNHVANVGVAVAVEEGLLVPVIRKADAKGIESIAYEVRELAAKARERKLQPEEMEGNTFTISNLGMFGIEEFTAIINPPESAILAIGAIQDEAVVRDGQIVPAKIMRVTMSCDHRVIDGATGSEFLQTLKGMLENPMTMLL